MRAIVDTGPLVAFFDRSERHHRWTADRIEELDAPLLLCEPVLTETIYLLGRFPRAQDALFGLLENGALAVAFRLEEHIGMLHRLLRKYRDAPMSLADACVVRMAEIHEGHCVLTLDSDFTVYRKHGRPPLEGGGGRQQHAIRYNQHTAHTGSGSIGMRVKKVDGSCALRSRRSVAPGGVC